MERSTSVASARSRASRAYPAPGSLKKFLWTMSWSVGSAGAIVAYFVYTLVLPGAFGALAAFQEWFRDLQPWLDLNSATTRLYDEQMTAEYWAQLGVAALLWLVVPLAVGLFLVRRSEVK